MPPRLSLLSLLTISAGLATSAPVHRIVRVSPPEARGAVEVSVAINPTNPDHLVAASVARVKEHPGITDFAYVSTDTGRTWKMVPRANPHQTQQGDDAVTMRQPQGSPVRAVAPLLDAGHGRGGQVTEQVVWLQRRPERQPQRERAGPGVAAARALTELAGG